MGIYTLDARDLGGGKETRALLEDTLVLFGATTRARNVGIFLHGGAGEALCAAATGPGAKGWLGQSRSSLDQPGVTSLVVPIASSHRALGFVRLEGFANPKQDKRVATLLAKQLSASLTRIQALKSERFLAKRDPLTGLRNTRGLNGDLERIITQARKARCDMTVMFLDVDRLKRVNSRLGHAAGSEALRRTGKILTDHGGKNLIYRFGGDEFVIVGARMGADEARDFADALRHAIASGTQGPMKQGGGTLPRITVSIGIATLRTSIRGKRKKPQDTKARLLAAADRALFRAKTAGRNKTRVATKRDDRL